MTTRSRVFLIVAILLLALVAGGLYFLTSNLNGIVANLIESQGSAATQTAVRVKGVDISLADASATISGLSIANPEGFPGNAIELGAFSVQLDAGSLTSDTIILKTIAVDSARINVLQQGTGNNLQVLAANLKKMQPEPAPEAQDSGKRIIIDRFTLNNASASVSIPELGETREATMPTITVSDIGRASNGATAAQVAQQILRPVVEAAISSAATQVIKDRAKGKINDAVGGFLNKLKDK